MSGPNDLQGHLSAAAQVDLYADVPGQLFEGTESLGDIVPKRKGSPEVALKTNTARPDELDDASLPITGGLLHLPRHHRSAGHPRVKNTLQGKRCTYRHNGTVGIVGTDSV